VSDRKRWITGELSVEGTKRARDAADQQLAEYPEKDRGDLKRSAGMPREKAIFQENAALERLAEVLGVDVIPRDYKCRWSSRTADRAELAIAPKEIKAMYARRWVLVTGRAPNFTIQGWCWAHEAEELGEWRERPKVQRDAWFIHWTKLRNPPATPTTGAAA